MTRSFSDIDDKKIVQQSLLGDITLSQLAKEIHASREAVVYRANTLGVEPKVLFRRRRSTKKEIEDRKLRHKIEEHAGDLHLFTDECTNPVKIEGTDRLLLKLYNEHGDRRYESLQILNRARFSCPLPENPVEDLRG